MADQKDLPPEGTTETHQEIEVEKGDPVVQNITQQTLHNIVDVLYKTNLMGGLMPGESPVSRNKSYYLNKEYVLRDLTALAAMPTACTVNAVRASVGKSGWCDSEEFQARSGEPVTPGEYLDKAAKAYGIDVNSKLREGKRYVIQNDKMTLAARDEALRRMKIIAGQEQDWVNESHKEPNDFFDPNFGGTQPPASPTSPTDSIPPKPQDPKDPEENKPEIPPTQPVETPSPSPENTGAGGNNGGNGGDGGNNQSAGADENEEGNNQPEEIQEINIDTPEKQRENAMLRNVFVPQLTMADIPELDPANNMDTPAIRRQNEMLRRVFNVGQTAQPQAQANVAPPRNRPNIKPGFFERVKNFFRKEQKGAPRGIWELPPTGQTLGDRIEWLKQNRRGTSSFLAEKMAQRIGIESKQKLPPEPIVKNVPPPETPKKEPEQPETPAEKPSGKKKA